MSVCLTALKAIVFAEAMMRGGQADSETPRGHMGFQMCQDCQREGEDGRAVSYCPQCDVHMCRACHEHHSQRKRTNSHETHPSEIADSLFAKKLTR